MKSVKDLQLLTKRHTLVQKVVIWRIPWNIQVNLNSGSLFTTSFKKVCYQSGFLLYNSPSKNVKDTFMKQFSIFWQIGLFQKTYRDVTSARDYNSFGGFIPNAKIVKNPSLVGLHCTLTMYWLKVHSISQWWGLCIKEDIKDIKEIIYIKRKNTTLSCFKIQCEDPI